MISQDYELTLKIREAASAMGADLIGFANVERFANAPLIMSPQGILPTARSVVVCGIHLLDLATEIDGEITAHDADASHIQSVMNNKLDHLSFAIACKLEQHGYPSIPIAASNIWRYRQYSELNSIFTPDISHIYAAVAAGLSVLGWNGLSLTPEYGPRNRFVSIITEAPLVSSPLCDDTLCDMCGECIRHCPTHAYTTETGEAKTLDIDNKKYRFANKNLWRCAWAEHFALSLDLPIPAVVDEKVITDTALRHGLRTGTLGLCLKVCVPPTMRENKPEFTRFAHRKNQFEPTGLPLPRKYIDQAMVTAAKMQIDEMVVLPLEAISKKGVDIKAYTPQAQSIVLLVAKIRNDADTDPQLRKECDMLYQFTQEHLGKFAGLDIARMFDSLGIPSLGKLDAIRKEYDSLYTRSDAGYSYWIESAIVGYELPEMSIRLRNDPQKIAVARNTIEKITREAGADLFGVTDVGRLDHLVSQLRTIHEGETILDANDKNTRFLPYEAEVSSRPRKLYSACDYIKNAKSVIVLGKHFPYSPVQRAGKPPAEAVGPYVFTQYQASRELHFIGYTVVKKLQEMGYKAVFTTDLTKMGSLTCSPRGPVESPINNSFEAVCAGIGQLTYNGCVNTTEYGIMQKFVAVVTNLAIQPDTVMPANEHDMCVSCRKCVTACPVSAIRYNDMCDIEIGKEKYRYLPIDILRCQWASRYALSNKDGSEYLGSKVNVKPPETISANLLREALKTHDPINKQMLATAHSCVLACPLVGSKYWKQINERNMPGILKNDS
jgi:epoxyqueuosine reductase QueG